METADAIMIGSGQGRVLSLRSWQKKGARLFYVSAMRWVGVVINYGCTPSEAFLVAGRAHKAASLGIYTQDYC